MRIFIASSGERLNTAIEEIPGVRPHEIPIKKIKQN